MPVTVRAELHRNNLGTQPVKLELIIDAVAGTATGTYTDNTTQDLTAAVTWSSSATGVATILVLPHLARGFERAFRIAELPLAMRLVLHPESEALSKQISGAWAAFARGEAARGEKLLADALGGVDPSIWGDLAVVAGFAVAALALGAATLRRRTA